MIREIAVDSYRSIRKLHLALTPVTVVLGPNGCGKTNLYRSMYLLGAAAGGRLARTLADEGGMPSALWAGGRKKGPVRMTIRVDFDDFGYQLSCGLPIRSGSAFHLDPLVKEEHLIFHQRGGSVGLLERTNASAWLRDADGVRVSYPIALRAAESVLAQIQDPQRFPVVASVRQEIGAWRFYHHFRTDQDAPLRHPQVGIQTPVLSDGGNDLAAALQTINEIGDGPALAEELARAFPGAELSIDCSPDVRMEVAMRMPGLQRPLRASELSDGTLRYLCLLAALLSPRPPTFLALNEPETSLHPDLMVPLAHLVARAARSSQLLITTHASALAGAITSLTGAPPVHLHKVAGATELERSPEDPAGESEGWPEGQDPEPAS
jgi:predicted ATPase